MSKIITREQVGWSKRIHHSHFKCNVDKWPVIKCEGHKSQYYHYYGFRIQFKKRDFSGRLAIYCTVYCNPELLVEHSPEGRKLERIKIEKLSIFNAPFSESGGKFGFYTELKDFEVSGHSWKLIMDVMTPFDVDELDKGMKIFFYVAFRFPFTDYMAEDCSCVREADPEFVLPPSYKFVKQETPYPPASLAKTSSKDAKDREEKYEFSIPSTSSTLSRQRLSDDLAKQFLREETADVFFEIGNWGYHVVPAHKFILMSRVDYFDKLFRSGMKEASTNRIELKDDDYSAFIRMLKFIYCGQIPDDLNEVAEKLLPMAEKYGIEQLKEACLNAKMKKLSVAGI